MFGTGERGKNDWDLGGGKIRGLNFSYLFVLEGKEKERGKMVPRAPPLLYSLKKENRREMGKFLSWSFYTCT